MIVGLLMVFFPIIIYLITLPLSRGLKPRLRKFYRILGGILVFFGSGTSLYLAAYTGDQGGIAAYFFQMTIITIYVVFLIVMVSLNRLLQMKRFDKSER